MKFASLSAVLLVQWAHWGGFGISFAAAAGDNFGAGNGGSIAAASGCVGL